MNDRWINLGYEENEKLKPVIEQPAEAFDQDRIGLSFEGQSNHNCVLNILVIRTARCLWACSVMLFDVSE